MKASLLRNKYRSYLIADTVAMLAEFIVLLSDKIKVPYKCITGVGDERICIISSAVQAVSNIALSIVLGLYMGIFAVAPGGRDRRRKA